MEQFISALFAFVGGALLCWGFVLAATGLLLIGQGLLQERELPQTVKPVLGLLLKFVGGGVVMVIAGRLVLKLAFAPDPVRIDIHGPREFLSWCVMAGSAFSVVLGLAHLLLTGWREARTNGE